MSQSFTLSVLTPLSAGALLVLRLCRGAERIHPPPEYRRHAGGPNKVLRQNKRDQDL